MWTGRQASARPTVSNLSYSDAVMDAFGVSAGGAAVSAASASRVSAVAACVQKIAGTISTLRLDVLQVDGDGERKLPRDALWYKLNEQPSPQFTATSHWEGAVSKQLMRGDGHTWIRRNYSGTIIELLPLPWGSVSPVQQRDGSVRYYICLPERCINTWVDSADILHFHGHDFNGISSKSVIAWGAKNAIGNALAMDEYSGKFFEGGAHPSMILSSAAKMDPEQIAALQSAFVRKYAGLANAHAVPLVLTEGLTAKEISLSAEDAQLLEARKFQVTDIARAFGVPPHMIGETSGSSAVGAGYEQQARDFVMHTLRLHLKRMEQELNRKLFVRDIGKFVRFDLGDLIEGDSKAQAEYNRAALGGPGSGPGWMAPDEIRKTKGLAPKGGLSAEIYDPRNIVAPAPAQKDPAIVDLAGAMREMRASNDMQSERITSAFSNMAPVVNITSPAPIVNVTMPEQAGHTVNVTNQMPDQAPPAVTVMVPEQAAPLVSVVNHLPENPPAAINIAVPEQAAPVVNVVCEMPEQPPATVQVVNNIAPAEVNVTLPDRKIVGMVERNDAGQIVKTMQIETDL